MISCGITMGYTARLILRSVRIYYMTPLLRKNYTGEVLSYVLIIRYLYTLIKFDIIGRFLISVISLTLISQLDLQKRCPNGH